VLVIFDPLIPGYIFLSFSFVFLIQDFNFNKRINGSFLIQPQLLSILHMNVDLVVTCGHLYNFSLHVFLLHLLLNLNPVLLLLSPLSTFTSFLLLLFLIFIFSEAKNHQV
jgi:hypothetical protein